MYNLMEWLANSMAKRTQIRFAFLAFSLMLSSCGPKLTENIQDSPNADSAETAVDVKQDYFKPGEVLYENHIYEPFIKTVQFNLVGNVNSTAVIENPDQILELSFDDLRAGFHQYFYKIILCDYNWEPSNMFENEYLEGFFNDQITSSRNSFNSLQVYANYRLQIPNQRVNIKLPGNYLLLIYEDDPERPVLTRRFQVASQRLTLSTRFLRAIRSEDVNSKHKINFEIDASALNMNNPFSELKVLIRQNDRWDNALWELKPVFVNNDKLTYQFNGGENLFEGGNEFRSLDIRSLQQRNMRVRRIWKDSLYHVEMEPDLSRSYLRHQSYNDLNGGFVIDQFEQDRRLSDADYAWVHLSYIREQPFQKGNLYLFGELTGWQFDTDSRMDYNYANKRYEKVLLLKQGFYDYHYLLLEDGKKEATTTYTEGSHFETENDYEIVVYHRPPGQRWDAIVAYLRFNSLD